MRILRNGDTGNEVVELQTALNRAGSNIAVDGIFGGKTEAAVKAFQKANNLPETGVVDSRTWATLNAPTNTQLFNAFVSCLDAMEELPEFKQLVEMFYG